MSFLRGLAGSANKKIIDTETERLNIIKNCYALAWKENLGDEKEVVYPLLFQLGHTGKPLGSGGLSTDELKTVPNELEETTGGDVATFAIDIVKLTIDFQQTPQCPKRVVFGDKWDCASMLVLEEIKSWCVTTMYALTADEEGLLQIFIRISFLEQLISNASAIFVAAKGDGVNDSLRSLLAHFKTHILEDQAAPTMITVLEDAALIDNPPVSGRAGIEDDTKVAQQTVFENFSEVYLYLPQTEMYFDIDTEKHKVSFVSNKEDASTFQVVQKSRSQSTVFGLKHTDTECYLFSPMPMTSAFHGPFGGESLYCRYKTFRRGEQFVFISKSSVGGHNEGKSTITGVFQHYYNHKFWGLSDNRMKIKMTKEPSDALIVECQLK